MTNRDEWKYDWDKGVIRSKRSLIEKPIPKHLWEAWLDIRDNGFGLDKIFDECFGPGKLKLKKIGDDDV